MGGFRNADTDVGDHGHGTRRRQESPPPARAKIDAVIRTVDGEGLGEFAGAGAERSEFLQQPAPFHFRDAAHRLKGADEDKSLLVPAFHEDVEQPVDAVVQIDVRGARVVRRDKFAGAFEGERDGENAASSPSVE